MALAFAQKVRKYHLRERVDNSDSILLKGADQNGFSNTTNGTWWIV
jgi:hypothetical protein